jgi:large conductance mechanosensitive channel
MLKEFKEFAMRGNVVDMAVGILIGTAFGAIVNSVVADVLMPVVGLLTGGADFSNMFALLKEGTTPGPYASLTSAKEAGAVTMGYGVLINSIVNFVIVAAALLVVIKAVNAARRAPAPEPAAPAPPSIEQVLLTEIRDLLARR